MLKHHRGGLSFRRSGRSCSSWAVLPRDLRLVQPGALTPIPCALRAASHDPPRHRLTSHDRGPVAQAERGGGRPVGASSTLVLYLWLSPGLAGVSERTKKLTKRQHRLKKLLGGSSGATLASGLSEA